MGAAWSCGIDSGTVWGQAAVPFAEALLRVRRSDAPDLHVERFQALGCMDLVVDLQSALDELQGGTEGAAGSDTLRMALLQQLLDALQSQHAALLRGWASAPKQSEWRQLRKVRFVVHTTEAAQAALLAAAQDQRLTVRLGDAVVALPVTPVAARLPADHAQIEMRGVPDGCARQGVTEALLAAAGYGPEQGVAVAHERLGMVRGPTGEPQRLGRLDMVVAVVATPRGDGLLQRLPRQVQIAGQEVSIEVHASLALPAVQLRGAATPGRGGAPRGPVLDRVGAAHGLTREVRAAGPPPVAEEAVRRSLPPGCRAGLGSGPTAAITPPPPPPRPLPTLLVPRPLPDIEVPDAPPLPVLPLDEPLFGAAVEYLQDATELTQEEMHQVVLEVRRHNPAEYMEFSGVTRVGDLPQSLKLALHLQARHSFGARGGLPCSVSDAWEQGEETASEEGAMSEGEGCPASGPACHDGGEGAGLVAQPAYRRGRSQSQCSGAVASMPQPSPRSSSRVHTPTPEWWVVRPVDTAPKPATAARASSRLRKASPRPTGNAGSGRGRRPQ